MVASATDDLVNVITAVAGVGLKMALVQLSGDVLDVCSADVACPIPEQTVQVDDVTELLLVWVHMRKDLVLTKVLTLPQR